MSTKKAASDAGDDATAEESDRPRARRPSSWLRKVVVLTAVAYPIVLALIVLAFCLIGERWWATTVALYLPRLGFALPLPVLVLALLVARAFRWLWTQVVALIILVVPLMGFSPRLSSAPAAAPAGALSLRVLTFNINGGSWGVDKVLHEIEAVHPDIIILQEVPRTDGPLVKSGLAGYFQQADGQFIVASRFPVAPFYIPPTISHLGKNRTAHWVRTRITTPRGDITVYDIHPVSPRDALDELQGDGLRSQVASGRIFDILRGEGSAKVLENVRLRVAQVESVAKDAAGTQGPILIAGDTNLPQLSWALAHAFGDFQDGFREVGRGFGYTFPAPRHPWMRIDRVLANARFRFLDLFVPRVAVSDHLPVVADLALLPP